MFTRFLLNFIFVIAAVLPGRPQSKPRVSYPYLLYLPKEYAASAEAFPLVIYLHGGSQKGNDLEKLKAYGPPKEVADGRNFPFVIASPQCPEGKYWSTDNWFEPLYAELTQKYRIDKKRIYLTGISMGGYGTWQTAVAYPDHFAAILPLCGGCDDSTQICSLRKVPVWTLHGTADDVIPIHVTERLVSRLQECGGNVRFTRLEGEGHGIQTYYANSDWVNWLLRRHR